MSTVVISSKDSIVVRDIDELVVKGNKLISINQGIGKEEELIPESQIVIKNNNGVVIQQMQVPAAQTQDFEEVE